MKALVVYDSVFGNTEKIAQAMGAVLLQHGDAEVVRVTQVSAGRLQGLDLLLVGSPTHQFKMTPATQEFLNSLAAGALNGVQVAGFDTRVVMGPALSVILRFFIKIFGYAAEPIAKQLLAKGGRQALPPEGFIVTGREGPLKDGETERAAAWAEQAAQTVPAR